MHPCGAQLFFIQPEQERAFWEQETGHAQGVNQQEQSMGDPVTAGHQALCHSPHATHEETRLREGDFA